MFIKTIYIYNVRNPEDVFITIKEYITITDDDICNLLKAIGLNSKMYFWERK